MTPGFQRAALTVVAIIVAAYATSQPGQFGLREVALAVAPTLLAWAHVSRPGDTKKIPAKKIATE